MVIQNQVKRTLKGNLDVVCSVVASESKSSRTAIANKLCERLNLIDPKGNLQKGSCLKALRELEEKNLLKLPTARTKPRLVRRPSRLGYAVSAPKDVPDQVDLIQSLELQIVEGKDDLRIWNELVISEHPLGEGPLVGRQVRYLVVSEHGYLGALGFGSCALQLRDREQWIGWDHSQRDAHLHNVLGLARFLIRPAIRCSNLASKVLSISCKKIRDDFEKLYGYRLWLLESFVDQEDYKGTCYRAANWIHVGSTCGRGRQDRKKQFGKTKKDIFLYVLDAQFRQYLGVSEPVRYPPLDVTKSVDREDWAAEEFKGAPMGDKRLEKRLISIVSSKSKFPGLPFAEAVQGDTAAVTGYYRFIDAPEESQISMSSILHPHRERTLQRMNHCREVLCIHDSTDLNYATLEACEGLGMIGRNQTKTVSRGLRLHGSFVVDLENSLPLGILHAKCYAPRIKSKKQKKKDSRQIPIQEKETFRWITSLETCDSLARPLERTRLIHVMDREGDFFELFEAWKKKSRSHLVIRAHHDRRTHSSQSLFEQVKNSKLLTTLVVDIPRKSARPKKGKTAAQPSRNKRRATLEMRSCQTQILPPNSGLNKDKAPVDVFILHVKETCKPADGSRPVEWFLTTTMTIDTAAEAEKVFTIYTKRWRIEEWHRVLKTGCRAEDPCHRSATNLKRLLAINMVQAWRVMLMMLLGRSYPDLPPNVLFSNTQIELITHLARKWKRPPPKVLNDYIIYTAKLGGYLNRKGDGPPGAEILLRGLTTLIQMCAGFSLNRVE